MRVAKLVGATSSAILLFLFGWPTLPIIQSQPESLQSKTFAQYRY